MALKDYFSSHAPVYATFRPNYPEALYQFIFRNVKHYGKAWDCATGNGQAAQYLAGHFKEVYATDISQQQLDNAFHARNIHYALSPAEHTPFEDNLFDLVTVGQALHWFDRDKFYAEVKRVGKPGGLLVVWGYALLYIEPEVDALVADFYANIVGPYWDDARRLVEEEYKSIDFPFDEILCPRFSIDVEWTVDHLAGYFESWSATQKYIRMNGESPVPGLREKLQAYWKPGEVKQVRFPVFMKAGRI